ncbi:MAG: threonine/serine dehydratase [Candidatus Melainabacteria bacterium]|nr:threonine/serine dehydratase [Candidatus Melainabacteria bacterium]
MLTVQTIQEAATFLKPQIVRTPLEYSPVLSKHLGVPVYLKLEFLQYTGSFKVRGGLYALSLLTEEQKKRGVATCSAGNHGLGLAYAASKAKVPCTVYVPKTVDETKFKKLKSLGADVQRSSFPGYDETMRWAKTIIEEKKLHFISAFDDEAIMAANGGTLALEILEELPDAKQFVFPCGGGGLSAGFAFYAKHKVPNAKLIACQLKGSHVLKISLEKGAAVTELPSYETVAGAIEGGLGANCFRYLKGNIDHVPLISEEEIYEAFRWMLANHQYLIEPAAAVPIAACLKKDLPKLTGTTVLVLPGRNVSVDTIKKMLA